MKTASQELRHEHDEILTAVNVLEVMTRQFKNNQQPPVDDVKNAIIFMEEFTDECHHEKEEHYYFPALEDIDLDKSVDELEDEHEKGRELIKDMKDAAEDENINKDKFVEATESLIELLRHHIEEENTKVFPIGDARIPEEKQQKLLEEFEEFEIEEIGEDRHDELHELLENLKNKYLKEQ